MKKRNLLLVATLMLSCFVAGAQNTNKGDKIIGLGLGFGNNFTRGGEGYSKSFLPVSAFMEAIVKDDIFDDGKGSIGVGGFAQYMNYNYLVDNVSPIGGGVVSSLALKSAQAGASTSDWKYNKFIIGPRGYLHYGFLENLDTYTGLMLGLDFVSWGTGNSDYTHTAFAWSWFIGGRYYFADNLAGMLELGYGATYVNIGIALKLGN
jgi:hypothetical protein